MKFFVLCVLFAFIALVAAQQQGMDKNFCPNGYIIKKIWWTDNINIDSQFAAEHGFSSHVGKDLAVALKIYYKTEGIVNVGTNKYQLIKGAYVLELVKEGSLVFSLSGDIVRDGISITFESKDTSVYITVRLPGNRGDKIVGHFKNVNVALTGLYPLTNAFWDVLSRAEADFQYINNAIFQITATKTTVDILTQTCAPKAATTLCPKQGCPCLCDANDNTCRGLEASVELSNNRPVIRLVPEWCICRGGDIPAIDFSASSTSILPDGSASVDANARRYEKVSPSEIAVSSVEEHYTCPYFLIQVDQICEYVNASYCKKSVTDFSDLTLSAPTTDSDARTWVFTGNAKINDNKGIGAVSVFFRLTIRQILATGQIEISFQLNQASGSSFQWVPYQQDRLVFTLAIHGSENLVLTSSTSGAILVHISGEAQVPNEKNQLQPHDASAQFVFNFPQIQNDKGASAPVTVEAAAASQGVRVNVGFSRDSFNKERILTYGPITGGITWVNTGSLSSVPILPDGSESVSVSSGTGSNSAPAGSDSAAPSTGNGAVDPNARETGSPASTINSWMKMEL